MSQSAIDASPDNTFTRAHKAIAAFLDQYKRPITILDLNPQDGFYSFNIAQNYDATCVMLTDPEHAPALQKRYTSHQEPDNVIVLSHVMHEPKLLHLADCEHFDVVLALHLPDEKKKLLTIMTHLNASYLITDLSPNEKHILVQKNNGVNGVQLLTKLPTTNLYAFTLNKSYLCRRTWFDSKKKNANYHIVSSFKEKKLSKLGGIVSTWHKGINLMTFKMLNGIIPGKKKIKQAITAIKNQKSSDWLPHNIIIAGTKATLIDLIDTNRKHIPTFPVPQHILKLIYAFIEEDQIHKMKNKWWRLRNDYYRWIRQRKN